MATLSIPGRQSRWRIYAFTDRPRIVPGAADGSSSHAVTPRALLDSGNEKLEFEITDPRGTKVKEGKSDLNAFGSAFGSVGLTEAMPLGEYRVSFWDDGRHNNIGNAVLFRLEEYKLPEYKVSVTTPEEDGKKKAFRLGEKVEVTFRPTIISAALFRMQTRAARLSDPLSNTGTSRATMSGTTKT